MDGDNILGEKPYVVEFTRHMIVRVMAGSDEEAGERAMNGHYEEVERVDRNFIAEREYE